MQLTRDRVAIVAVLVALTAAAAATPGLDAPFRRLANYDADTADPITTVAVDTAALRRAAAVLPDGARYYVHLYDDTSGQLTHDVNGVARLLLLPALPVRRLEQADWVLSYRHPQRVPEGASVARSVRVGEGVYVLQLD